MKIKRSQSSVEFLMTYGWIIVVAGLSVVALWQMGVLNPMPCEKWQMGFSQVIPTDWAAYRNSDTLVLKVENQAGDAVEVTNANAVVGNVSCSLASNAVVLPGGNAVLSLDCSGPPSLSDMYQFGDCYIAEVEITYLNRRSGHTHASKGDVRSAIEEGAAVTTTTTTTTSTTTTSTTTTTTTTINNPPVVVLISPLSGSII